jgi:hypothetical protein
MHEFISSQARLLFSSNFDNVALFLCFVSQTKSILLYMQPLQYLTGTPCAAYACMYVQYYLQLPWMIKLIKLRNTFLFHG